MTVSRFPTFLPKDNKLTKGKKQVTVSGTATTTLVVTSTPPASTVTSTTTALAKRRVLRARETCPPCVCDGDVLEAV